MAVWMVEKKEISKVEKWVASMAFAKVDLLA